jgi:hypothetical protein
MPSSSSTDSEQSCLRVRMHRYFLAHKKIHLPASRKRIQQRIRCINWIIIKQLEAMSLLFNFLHCLLYAQVKYSGLLLCRKVIKLGLGFYSLVGGGAL